MAKVLIYMKVLSYNSSILIKNKGIFMKTTKTITLALLSAIFFLIGCNSNSSSDTILPNSIEVNASGLYPEGISYNSKDKRFYLGSYHQGKIVSLDSEGKLYPFAEDESLITIVGVEIDEKNNRLIACNTDLGFSVKSSNATIAQLAKVEVYDLSTQKKIQTYDLSTLYQGGHFVNDLTLDKAGNIYVTDSFSPVIYKIAMDSTLSIFAQDDRFVTEQGQFGLNGIVSSDDYLIVAKSEGAKLFKIALDNGENIQEIEVDKNLNSIDGLLLNAKNELLVSSNNFVGQGYDEAVYKLSSSDTWKSATVIDTFKVEGNVYPTTLTNIDNTVYVNHSYLPKLIKKEPNHAMFKIQKVVF